MPFLGELTMRNRVTELLGVQYPIILGAMRLITFAEMAAAVSNSGGFGQIAASGLSAERLRAELEKARGMTGRPVGVNIPIYRPNAREALEVAIAAGVRIVTTSAGHPGKLINRIKEAGLKVLHKVSTLDMALKAEAAGVDGVIACGLEAGGHIGRDGVASLCLIPELVDALKVPVIAAGGIADARGLLAALTLGAEGVEMGTRFLATRECPVPDYYKERVLQAKGDSTIVIGERTMPMRVLKKRTDEAPGEGEADVAATDVLYATEGVGEKEAVMPCGQVAGLIREPKGAGEVIPEMVEAVRSLFRRLNVFFEEDRR